MCVVCRDTLQVHSPFAGANLLLLSSTLVNLLDVLELQAALQASTAHQRIPEREALMSDVMMMLMMMLMSTWR